MFTDGLFNMLGSIGASLIGGAWSFGETKMTNKSNAKQNQLNRDFLAQQQEDAQKFNEEQADLAYQRQRSLMDDYQTISAKARDIENAGLNPDVLLGSASVGSSSVSSASSSPVGAPSNIPMQSSQMGGFLANIFDKIADIDLKESQARQNDTLTPVLYEKGVVDIIKSCVESKKTAEETRQMIGLYQLNYQAKEQEIKESQQRTNNLKATFDQIKLQNQMLELNMPFVQARSVAEIQEKISLSNLHDAQSAESTARKIYTQLQSEGIKFTPEQWDKFKQSTINKLESEAQDAQATADFNSRTLDSRVSRTKRDNTYGSNVQESVSVTAGLMLDSLYKLFHGKNKSDVVQ